MLFNCQRIREMNLFAVAPCCIELVSLEQLLPPQHHHHYMYIELHSFIVSYLKPLLCQNYIFFTLRFQDSKFQLSFENDMNGTAKLLVKINIHVVL